MNPTEYVKNVLVTEARDMGPLQRRFAEIRNIRLSHGAFGLSSELCEAQELVEKPVIDGVNLKEEMGDLFWYMGIVTDELKLDPNVVFMFNDTDKIKTFNEHEQRSMLQAEIHGMVKSIGRLVDLLKKSVMYGKALNENGILVEMQATDYHINRALRLFGQTSEGARERNIEKLRARYGDKFTEAAALDRDLVKERQVLEEQLDVSIMTLKVEE